MTAPVPLSTPTGAVVAYACGGCGRVAHGGDSLAPTAEEALAEEAESSRNEAERCCTCASCGAAAEREWHCASCSWRIRFWRTLDSVGTAAYLGITTQAAWDAWLDDGGCYESGLP